MSGEDVPSHSAKKADAQHSVAESRDQAETETNQRESESTPINQHSPIETTKKAKDHNQNEWRTQKKQ